MLRMVVVTRAFFSSSLRATVCTPRAIASLSNRKKRRACPSITKICELYPSAYLKIKPTLNRTTGFFALQQLSHAAPLQSDFFV